MSVSLKPPFGNEVVYPESDGQPIAENNVQYEWVTTIKWGLEFLFAEDPNVFVAGDMLWYPVEGNPLIRVAPDAMVAFGQPKGRRGSYRQWEEAGIAPQVVFEVLSPGNRFGEMFRKLRFYERDGVEECYLYDPDGIELTGWRRTGERLETISEMDGWVSPRLGIRFEVSDTLRIFGPDHRPFATYVEIARQRDASDRACDRANKERVEAERQRDEAEQQRAEAESRADEATQERDQATQERDAERVRAQRLREQLRAMGLDPNRLSDTIP